MGSILSLLSPPPLKKNKLVLEIKNDTEIKKNFTNEYFLLLLNMYIINNVFMNM